MGFGEWLINIDLGWGECVLCSRKKNVRIIVVLMRVCWKVSIVL